MLRIFLAESICLGRLLTYFQDVVLYLSDGLCYTEAGQPVYVAQEEEQEEEVVGRTEVQSAILSIVETGTDTSS